MTAWQHTHSSNLVCYEICSGPEGRTATVPPERVLQVSVVDDSVFLSICTFEETSKTTTCTTIKDADAMVDARALLLALTAQMGVEFVLPLVQSLMPGRPS